MLDESCASSTDCCPGFTCSGNRCRPPTTTCFGTGNTSVCASEAQCCGSLVCAFLRNTMRCCTGARGGCRTSAECCGQMLCVAGRCACREPGTGCNQDGDCCTGRCSAGRCVP
ncbi:MAG: hypothetical protein IPF99_19370 [Deltaproteobacteria bacterium]|nr:hypothetical protein [Deltaproteobacteria bacterium]